ncbi:mastermind [Reticulomyxa filosa]|uniref:Mastermind n=1 Tax=Reticulomyxa filosa TaxID=46433 RepID=X6NEB3_RETFI|nr:mastermind [Reticulomyxa filosa]|eukprot:ETO23687.1 mastermind [Reticulomyxa filosa]
MLHVRNNNFVTERRRSARNTNKARTNFKGMDEDDDDNYPLKPPQLQQQQHQQHQQQQQQHQQQHQQHQQQQYSYQHQQQHHLQGKVKGRPRMNDDELRADAVGGGLNSQNSGNPRGGMGDEEIELPSHVLDSNASKGMHNDGNPHAVGLSTFDTLKWIQCDRCFKWRRIPNTVSDEELGEKAWYCELNLWDPLHNACEKKEEAYDANEEQTLTVAEREDENWIKERENFYAKLQMFYNRPENAKLNNNVEDFKSIRIGNAPLDFYQLWVEVKKYGGFETVNALENLNRWAEVHRCLSCYDVSCDMESAKHSLKQFYQKYLWPFELKEREDTKNHTQTIKEFHVVG